MGGVESEEGADIRLPACRSSMGNEEEDEPLITARQMKAARVLLGWDQSHLAQEAGLSLPTIQRMEASEGNVRGNVDSLVKVVAALECGGVELIAEGAASPAGGRGVRLRG